MFLRRYLAIFAVTALVGAPSPAAQLDPPPTVAVPVQIDIVYKERTLGTPHLSLMYDRPAIISVDRINGYSMRVVLTRTVVAGRIVSDVAMELFAEENGRWIPVSTPRMLVGAAGKASMEVARPEGGQPLLRLNVTVGSPTRLQQIAEPCPPSAESDWRKAMTEAVVYAPSVPTMTAPAKCCQGACFRCCGQSACCADPHNCTGRCCTDA